MNSVCLNINIYIYIWRYIYCGMKAFSAGQTNVTKPNAPGKVCTKQSWRHMTEKNLLRLSEKLVSHCIMGYKLRFLLKPLNTIVLWCTVGLSWAPMMPRGASLSESHACDRCCFSSLEQREYWINKRKVGSPNTFYCTYISAIYIYIQWGTQVFIHIILYYLLHF